MDDTHDMKPLVDDLRDGIDELQTALKPLLHTNHTDFTSKLPLLDKAKMSVLTTYAIESILFSVLKLNGVDAKQHPIFTELTRVKQYFEKVKDSENGGPAKRAKSRLNVPAAGRFIKADLAGNDKFEKERAERLAAVKKGALTKLDNRDVTPVSSSISPSKKRKADAELNEGSSPAKTRRVEAVVDGLAHEERDAVAEKYDAELLDTSPKPAIDDAEAAAAKRELKKAKKERKRERENEADGIVRRHSKHDTSKKSKSSKPPRNTKTVFKDLLNGKEGAANT